MQNDPTQQRDAIIGLARDWRAPTRPCPDDDALVHWHERQDDARTHDDVADHVALCARCYGRWQTLLEVRPVTLTARQTWASGLTRRRVSMFAAAASVVLVGLLMIFPNQSQLPDYQLSARGDATMRGALTATGAHLVVIADGGLVTLLLTPSERYTSGVEAAVWIDDGSDLAPLRGARVQQSDAGAIRIEAAAGAGTWHVVIAPRGALPSRTNIEHALSGAAAADTRAWQLHSIAVAIREH